MTGTRRKLLDAAMNAASLAGNFPGNRVLGAQAGLSNSDLKRARDALAQMPQDAVTTAFDRRDFLIERGWRPE